MVVEGEAAAGGGAAARGGGAMVGSLGEEAILFRAAAFFSLLAIGAQRSAAQDCQGRRRDWKGTGGRI